MNFLPLYLTFFSFFISFFFGKYLGIKGVCLITSICVFFSLIVSIFMFYDIGLENNTVYIETLTWLKVGLLKINWSFLFDQLTVVMLIVILFVSFCAHVYSIEYMLGDPHQIRFMSYLSLFTFFMLILVTSGNIFQLFLGWEGVGICSYLLINYWYSRLKANKSAFMAMLYNKISDLSLLVSFGLIFSLFKSFEYPIIISYIYNLDSFVLLEQYINFNILYFFFENQIVLPLNLYAFQAYVYKLQFIYVVLKKIVSFLILITFFLIIAAVGKSAQIGLHMWLPEAMEGPTPVSSLIHAATMVTAGIFLIVRMSFLFDYIPSSLLLIISLGSITSFLASTIGIFQHDLKKIIAYSTCSQLGYMFMSCGYNAYNYSMFHLFNHAFFKALLFLTAGYIIHSLSNEQDFRKMGGLLEVFPFSYICILVGSLAITGFPFLSGFYSKEKMLELYNHKSNFFFFEIFSFNNIFSFFFTLSTVSLIFTIIYSLKVLKYVYFFKYNGFFKYLFIKSYSLKKKNILFITHYPSYLMIIPLFLLAILSLISGYLFSDMLIGSGSFFWMDSISVNFNPNSKNWATIYSHEFLYQTHNITLIWTFTYLILFIYIYFFSKKYIYHIMFSSKFNYQIKLSLTEKYIYINKLFVDFIISKVLIFSYKNPYLLIDKGLLEYLGPYGLTKFLFNISNIKSKNNYIYMYQNKLVIFIIIYYLLLILIY